MSRIGIEKGIITTAAIFVLTLAGVIALTVKQLGIGLPTCLTDVRPFLEGKVIDQAPKRYEIHYVARMWKFEPAEISLRPGSTADIYLSTADVTHGLQIVGTAAGFSRCCCCWRVCCRPFTWSRCSAHVRGCGRNIE